MAYDPELDELIADLGPVGDTGMIGELRRYDGGARKVRIYRVVGAKGKRIKVCSLSLSHGCELGEFLTGVAAEHGLEA
jgi:hypothetical protein